MAFLDYRKSRGRKYWSVVESRRVNGKPRNFILEYLGTAESILKKFKDDEDIAIRSYSHGDIQAIVNIASEINIIDIINKHVSAKKNKSKPKRDGLTVGGSLLLAAIGRACQPTSKKGWYEWCKNTSLEYCLKRSFRGLDSQHFWDQMNFLPEEKIPLIEEEIVKQLIEKYDIKLDCLFFDTSNFFTFIDSGNEHCELPQRGKNKQKRYDLRQVGMALLVSRKEQFPLFHKSYRGDKNDITVFKEEFKNMIKRLKSISKELTDITIVFDKGNNSKNNFKMLDDEKGFHYVGGLVPSYFKELIKEANKNFEIITVNGKNIPGYRIKNKIWGSERTCVVIISNQLKEGQIRGIKQQYKKKNKELEEFKKQLENPKRRKIFSRQEIKEKLTKIIKGQFIEEILKYDFIELKDGGLSFTYYIDSEAFDALKKEVLGRKILVTNRHEWSSEEIILAYRGQSKVEYAFRNLKNPYHLAIRPQYHWTDQKIEVHFLICIIGYLLTIAAYVKVKNAANYKRNVSNFMEDLKSIRLACRLKKKSQKVKYLLEDIPADLKKITKILDISAKSLYSKLNCSCYN